MLSLNPKILSATGRAARCRVCGDNSAVLWLWTESFESPLKWLCVAHYGEMHEGERETL